jgi:gamma-glutamylaminecyclotransferase
MGLDECPIPPRNLIELPHRVFVYGTLKRNQPNHHFFEAPELGQCELVGTGRTVASFPLIVTTRWNLPFLLYAPGKGQKINGEVYDVDDRLMQWMDKFEGHPDVYERVKVHVRMQLQQQSTDDEVISQPSSDDDATTVCTETGSVVECACWAYFLKQFPVGLLRLETMSTYDANIKKYQPDKELCGPSSIEDALRQECELLNDDHHRD